MEQNKDLQPLSEVEIRQKLADLPGWRYQDNRIEKTLLFEHFSAAIDFINRLALFCDRIDHHPDINISYKKVRFTLTRFSIGGKVTERDFTVAKKIEEIFNEPS